MTMTWVNGRRLATLNDGWFTHTYQYNGDGLRTSKTTEDGTVNYFIVDGQYVGDERTVYGTKYVTMYLYDDTGSVIGLNSNGTLHYFAKNLQGDVVGILDAAGNVIVTYHYDAWGRVTCVDTENTLGVAWYEDLEHIAFRNPFRYRGYMYDDETGFYYLQSRYYDPLVGRFINADKFNTTGQGFDGNNMFAYCNNNPVNMVDITGDFPVFAVPAVAEGLMYAVAAISTVVTVGAVSKAIVEGITALPRPALSIPKAEEKVEAKEKEKVKTLPPDSSGTVIYRYYASKTENLSPRRGIDYDGLSFSTKPPRPGATAVVTTIEALNATGILYAIQGEGTHVTVRPRGGTVSEWMTQGQDSIWTQTLSNIVVEWDGGFFNVS